jgi:hypothetical protein
MPVIASDVPEVEVEELVDEVDVAVEFALIPLVAVAELVDLAETTAVAALVIVPVAVRSVFTVVSGSVEVSSTVVWVPIRVAAEVVVNEGVTVSFEFSQGASTHCDMTVLSTYWLFDFEGVKLRTYDVAKLPAAQATNPTKTSEFALMKVFWAQKAVKHWSQSQRAYCGRSLIEPTEASLEAPLSLISPCLPLCRKKSATRVKFPTLSVTHVV